MLAPRYWHPKLRSSAGDGGCSRRCDAHMLFCFCQRGRRSHLRKAPALNKGSAEEGWGEGGQTSIVVGAEIFWSQRRPLCSTLTEAQHFCAELLCNEALVIRFTELEHEAIAPNTSANWCWVGRYLAGRQFFSSMGLKKGLISTHEMHF